jgi:Tol biopolymer transport system component
MKARGAIRSTSAARSIRRVSRSSYPRAKARPPARTFLPGDKEIIYASTHLGGAGVSAKADQSQGYVWAIYDSYDIFRANADGSNLRRLTKTPGYDAEGTICPVDGSIIFTSVRDGDLDLYRMDADGKNVKRLTSTPGYDGAAFFSNDCKKIVWRASRPTGTELEDFQKLLKKGLVRPTKLELFVANADGSDAKQVTHLEAAAFGPYFFPVRGAHHLLLQLRRSQGARVRPVRDQRRWLGLERITHHPGFDGFPMFSPDGRHLAFASNRASKPGTWDTNLFVTSWSGEAARSQRARRQPLLPHNHWWNTERGGRGVRANVRSSSCFCPPCGG